MAISVIVIYPKPCGRVVVHVGSNKEFSAELYKLQSEVLPLWRLRPCPRDLKRTSMEKYFRGQGILSDWCSFQLTGSPETPLQSSEEGTSPSSGISSPGSEGDRNKSEESERVKGESEDLFFFKTSIPERSYGVGILLATIVPGTIGGLLGFLLIALLWSDRDEAAPA